MIGVIVKKILFYIGKTLHFCLNRTVYPVQFLFRYVYSGLVSSKFKSFHFGSFVEYPLYLTGGKNIEIGRHVIIGKRLRIETFDEYRGAKFNPFIRIGDFVGINHDCHIGAIECVEIGNNVLIASKVYISDHSHGNTSIEHLLMPPVNRPLVTKGKVIIEDDVWIGEGAIILPGVKIGRGAVVGANAVVTKDVRPYAVVGGVPAKVLKEAF
ncbi:acyltransferase [Sphingobacterium sp.]|uniref:acyltransferase n=1 Tax=Sphingobacterium sp. TaxID=341027 RepID=UPI0031D0DD5C